MELVVANGGYLDVDLPAGLDGARRAPRQLETLGGGRVRAHRRHRHQPGPAERGRGERGRDGDDVEPHHRDKLGGGDSGVRHRPHGDLPDGDELGYGDTHPDPAGGDLPDGEHGRAHRTTRTIRPDLRPGGSGSGPWHDVLLVRAMQGAACVGADTEPAVIIKLATHQFEGTAPFNCNKCDSTYDEMIKARVPPMVRTTSQRTP